MRKCVELNQDGLDYLAMLVKTLPCHKHVDTGPLCGEESAPRYSHDNWGMVTCLPCLALRWPV